jgi:hypothetical protein
MDFFSSDAFINEKKRRINQAEFESVFHFIDRAIKNLKLTPYSYLSEKLERINYKGYVFHDDVYSPDHPANNAWWESVTNIEKYNLTEIGHSTGTGLLNYYNDNSIIIK